MTNFIHQDLAGGRWHTLTLTEQLANVGSEFERAWNWRMKDENNLSESAFDRMSELLGLTISDPRWRGLRLRELARLREEINREWLDKRKSAPKDLSDYFMTFAVWSRAPK